MQTTFNFEIIIYENYFYIRLGFTDVGKPFVLHCIIRRVGAKIAFVLSNFPWVEIIFFLFVAFAYNASVFGY